MKRHGSAVMGERAPLAELDIAAVVRDLGANKVTLVDTRPNTEVHGGTVEGAP
jgi:hydroxyacylglutathione hydrolase